MALTPEEQERRKNDPRVKALKSWICDCEGNKPYVFISYKSDDWETVLADAVYRLVTEYGLNVYFDGSFDSHAEVWTKQFPKNMKDENCKGVIAFLDDKYATSYATLLELMYSQAINDGGDFIQKEVVPVNLSALSKIHDKTDTGLGQPVDVDGIRNVNAPAEKELFDKTFDYAYKHKILSDDLASAYIEVKEGNDQLTKKLCSNMVIALLGYIKKNDNKYQEGDDLENIVESIRDACGNEVFSEPPKPIEPPKPTKASISEQTILKEAHEKDKKLSSAAPSVGIWRYTSKDADTLLEWDGQSKSCVVKKGSKAAKEADGFGNLSAAKNMKEELKAGGYIENECFVKDYECDKISTLMNVLYGGSVSMPGEIKKGKLRRVSESDLIGSGEPESVVPRTEGSPLESSSGDRSGAAPSVGIWRYTSKDADALLEWDGQSKNCVVKKGSKAAKEADGFGNLSAA